jgi:kynurenine formamidase
MEYILPIDELPAGQFTMMFYEIHITKKENRTVITARDFEGAIYTFYANAFLEQYIEDMSDKRSFTFYNDRTLKAQIRIVSEQIKF